MDRLIERDNLVVNASFFKRIAIAAIAALGFGMLSSAPSQALIVSNAIAFDADDAVKTGESATAVLTHTLTGTSVSDSATVRVLITSANAGYVGNLYMRVSDSSTNISTEAGLGATSPNIYFGVQGTATPSGTFSQRLELTQSKPLC